MDPYAESAAAFADSARAAIAFIRATRDGRDDDAGIVAQGISPYRLALQVANVACHADLTDEFLDLELEMVNRADAEGSFERIARENNILPDPQPCRPVKKEGTFRPEILGETPAGLTIGTVTGCGTCKEHDLCCRGQGTCIVIMHPGEIIQHITAAEAWALVTLLIIAARKARILWRACSPRKAAASARSAGRKSSPVTW